MARRAGDVDAADVAEALKALPDAESRARRSESRAAVILGNDTVVAARPCSAAQLSHACFAAGFDIVVPPSWGDELVAGGYLEALQHCEDRVVAACACTRVTSLLARSTTLDVPRSVPLAAPPVAAARFLRLVYGESVLVTYVGDCPSATDPEIDARFTPVGFFASLHRQGVFVDAQSTEMDAADADRWRRHLSMPGGLPARRFLARPPVDRLLREVDVANADAQQWSTSRSSVLLDLAEAAGCACGGNRVWIEESEGARSSTPILVAPPGLSLRPEPSAPPPRGSPRARPRPTTTAASARDTDFRLAHDAAPNEEQPTIVADETIATAAPAPAMASAIVATSLAAATPQAPRASTPLAPPVPISPARQAVRPATRPVAAHTTRSAASREPRESTRRTLGLSLLPALVIALTAALGVAVYARTRASERSNATATPARPTAASDSLRAVDIADDVRPPASTATPAPVTSNGTTATAAATDSLARRAGDTLAVTPADSAAQAARRRLRRRTPEIVPGWMPQGQKSFNPADTTARRVPDSSGAKPPTRPDTIPRA